MGRERCDSCLEVTAGLAAGHLFLGVALMGLFCSLDSDLVSVVTLSGWFHSLCFCRRTLVANTASQ